MDMAENFISYGYKGLFGGASPSEVTFAIGRGASYRLAIKISLMSFSVRGA